MGARELDSIESGATLAVESANPPGWTGAPRQESRLSAVTALSTSQDKKL